MAKLHITVHTINSAFSSIWPCSLNNEQSTIKHTHYFVTDRTIYFEAILRRICVALLDCHVKRPCEVCEDLKSRFTNVQPYTTLYMHTHNYKTKVKRQRKRQIMQHDITVKTSHYNKHNSSSREDHSLYTAAISSNYHKFIVVLL